MEKISNNIVFSYDFDKDAMRWFKKLFLRYDYLDYTADVNVYLDEKLLFCNNIFVFDLACQLTIWLSKNEDFSYYSMDDAGDGLTFTKRENDVWEIKSDWSNAEENFFIKHENLISNIKEFLDIIDKDARRKRIGSLKKFLRDYYK